MSTIPSTLRYLYSLQDRGIKLGLRNTRVLLRHLGDPQDTFRSVHVAGTNGKGSTCAFLASILMEGGYRTGLYTSPHLVRFNERIRINGLTIPDNRLVTYVEEMRPFIEETRATFFEATTALAFRYFADEGAEIAVIETGLGGRLDATNVVRPIVSVIASIDFDHMHILGRTLTAIAREKGGIIKQGVPCVTSETEPAVLRVFRKIARNRNTMVRQAPRMISLVPGRRRTYRLKSRGFKTKVLAPPLAGDHQQRNAQLAVAACLACMQKGSVALRLPQIERGIEKVVRNAGIRARYERIGSYPQFILDVAHNPEGATALAGTILEAEQRPPVVVIGVMADKDLEGILLPLAPVAASFVTVTPPTDRALPERILRERIRRMGFPVRKGGTVAAGLRTAARTAPRGSAVLVTGSHYVVGSALAKIESSRNLTKNA